MANIIIGDNINYEKICKNHYLVFGVIDTTANKSLRSIKKQVYSCLDDLYQ
ncbi:hypothetical protein B7R60_01160 [Streptococcus pyogenes]|nr:hypothetical protein B7R60_01160 [Streptococcus pyogenes]